MERAYHVFVNPREVVVQLGLQGRTMKLCVCGDGDSGLRLTAKLCFLSYLAGPGKKIHIGGRPRLD